jgi:hypothetical protein
MASSIIVGKQNNLAYTFTVTGSNGVLVISGETEWDLGFTDIVRIVNTTHASTFGLSATTTFTNAFVSGLPTFTWSFTNLPAGSATADVLLIYLNVTEQQASISLLQYQKA